MLSSIATLVVMLIVILFPVLIPATVTTFHALAGPRLHARPERDRIGYDAEPTPASA